VTSQTQITAIRSRNQQQRIVPVVQGCAKSVGAKSLFSIYLNNVILNYKNILKFMNFTEF